MIPKKIFSGQPWPIKLLGQPEWWAFWHCQKVHLNQHLSFQLLTFTPWPCFVWKISHWTNLEEVFPPAFPSLLWVESTTGHNAKLPISHCLVCCSVGTVVRHCHWCLQHTYFLHDNPRLWTWVGIGWSSFATCQFLHPHLKNSGLRIKRTKNIRFGCYQYFS